MQRLWRGLWGLVGLIYILSFLVLPARAWAAGSNGFDLTTSPLPINLTALPGQTLTTGLRIQNSSTNVANIKVDLMKFKAAGDRGNPQLLDRQSSDDYFNWVSFSKTSFSADPGQ